MVNLLTLKMAFQYQNHGISTGDKMRYFGEQVHRHHRELLFFSFVLDFCNENRFCVSQ